MQRDVLVLDDHTAGVLIAGAVSGIPLWMVIMHPDTGPDAMAAKRVAYPVLTAVADGTIAGIRHDDVLADIAS